MLIHSLKAAFLGTAMLAGFVLAGCSANARRVECDGPLTPINAPLPVVPTTPPVQSEEGR